MHVATAIIITIIVVLAGLWPALADELRARRRDARDAAWTAARARHKADLADWARDRAHRTFEASWDAFKYGWETILAVTTEPWMRSVTRPVQPWMRPKRRLGPRSRLKRPRNGPP